MSLLAIAASALVASVQPVQTVHHVDLEHRGSAYRVAYRPSVESRLRTIGMAAGPRPSTQRCVVSVFVGVERAIAKGAGDDGLRTILQQRARFTESLPGSCDGRSAETNKLLANKSAAIEAHLAEVAVQDRGAALAAIDTAHHFATN